MNRRQDGLLLWIGRFGKVSRNITQTTKQLSTKFCLNKAVFVVVFNLWFEDMNQGPGCVGHPGLWGLHRPSGLRILWTCRLKIAKNISLDTLF